MLRKKDLKEGMILEIKSKFNVNYFNIGNKVNWLKLIQ